jgi:hypothetical protein
VLGCGISRNFTNFLADMGDFMGKFRVAPNAETGPAGAIAKHIILADDGSGIFVR